MMAEGPSEQSRYGGHDYEFVGEVANRYNCQICAKVIREPHLAVCCGQHFCESCLSKWFARQDKESCPHCRAEGKGFHHVINKGLRSEINQLKIKCSNRGEGCGWTGELGQLKMHLTSEKGCGFVIVVCPNKCQPGYTILRKELAVHLKSVCLLRPYQCKYCGHQDTFKEITGIVRTFKDGGGITIAGSNHLNKCPAYPLVCPNRCGVTNIKRKDMAAHSSKCPQEPVECPFAEAGCDGKPRRIQLDEHLASNQQKHLLLMMGAYKEVKNTLQSTEAKLKETEAKLKAMEAKLKATEAKLSTAVQQPNQAISGYHLKKRGDSIVIMMPNVTEHHHSGKTWYSPTFSYGAGYKMCLVVTVNPNNTSIVSINIQLLQGEHDDQLKWPVKAHEGHCDPPPLPRPPYSRSVYFRMCGARQLQGLYGVTMTMGIAQLVNDSLIFNVKYSHCDIKVELKD